MAIKIAISLTALSLIQIGMAEVWDRKGSAPNVGQDRQAHYLFIPHHCRITARWVGRGVVARLMWWQWFSSTKERGMKPKPSFFLAYIATSASH